MDPTSDVVYSTLVGTVPGAPLADILFQLAMVRFHARVRAALAEEDLQVKVFHPYTSELLSSSVPAWVDDIAAPIEASHACDLIPKVSKAMQIMEEMLRCTGVEVNFCRGKTEVLVAWRGKEAKKMRQYWCIERCGVVEVLLRCRQHACLHLVDRYVHLGSLVCSSGHVVEDIKHRAALARPSFKAIRDKLLRNPCLTYQEKKQLLVQGPVASFLHGAGTWVMSNGRKGQAFKAVSGVLGGFMRSSMRALMGWSPRGLTDEEVYLLTRVLDPCLTLAVAQLRHLVSVAEWLDDYALVVLLEEACWLKAVAQDLLELTRVVALDLRVPASLDFGEWRTFLKKLVERRGAFKAAILAAIKLWTKGDDCKRQCAAAKATCLTKLFDSGGVVWRLRDKSVVGVRTFACNICQGMFSNKAALGSHRRRMHGIKSARQDLGNLTACQRCRVEFWSVGRLWDHLRRRPNCLAAHVESDCDFGLTNDKSVNAETRPAAAFSGPQPFWATLRPHQASQPLPAEWDMTSLDRWQCIWDTYVRREHPNNHNPKNFGDTLRKFMSEESWQEKAARAHFSDGSFGQMCRILFEGHGSLLGFRVLSRGLVWAVCREGHQEAADAAICF